MCFPRISKLLNKKNSGFPDKMMGFSTLMLDADGVVRTDGEIKQNEHRLHPQGPCNLTISVNTKVGYG
jgi:hypothetical protein